MKTRLINTAAVFAAMGLLAACGGKDESSSNGVLGSSDFAAVSGTSVSLSDEATANKAAAAATAQIAESSDSGEPPSTPLSGASRISNGLKLNALDIIRGIPAQLANKIHPALSAASATERCPNGGSLTMSSNATSLPLMSGEYLRLAADDCIVTSQGVTTRLNGSYTLTVVSGYMWDSGVSIGSQADLVFSNFQTTTSDASNSLTFGLNGGNRVTLTSSNETTIASAPSAPVYTTVTKYNDVIHRTSVSNYMMTFKNYLSYSETTGGAVINTSHPRFSLPSSFAWEITSPLRQNTSGVITSGAFSLSSRNLTPASSATVTFGQSCENTTSCVNIERFQDGVSQGSTTLSWLAFSQL